MEIVSNTPVPISFKNAYLLERQGELPQSAIIYEKLLVKAPDDLQVLSRLMIISRKQKKYAKEVTYINKAIKIYELKYSKLKTKDLKVASISKKLNSLLGHTDKKGKNLLAIPEVEKLKKRKEIALKKKAIR